MRKRRRIVLGIDGLRFKRSAKFQLVIPGLTITPGTLICVVGANGSGKTTLMESLVGLLKPDEGAVLVCGQNAHLEIADVKRAIGFIPDDDAWLIPELTAREYFALLANIHASSQGQDRLLQAAYDLADELLFTSFDQLLGDLSHGNKKKVQIIAGLMHDPYFVIVDELRNGLDPIAILRAEQILKRKQLSGTAIIAATHDLWWAERFADEVVMIKRGHIVVNDFTKNIVERFGSLEARFMEIYGNEAPVPSI